MNNSGKEVRAVMTKSQIPNPNLIVVHDDVDLPFGTIRTSENSSSAGHKGVQSIINEIGSQNFTRIRIGINPHLNGGQTNRKIDAERFVLEKFTKEEKKQLKQIIKQAVEEIKKILAPNPASERQIFSQK